MGERIHLPTVFCLQLSSGLVGTQPPSSKLLVATHFCGEKPLLGMPRKGQSLPSVDGTLERWKKAGNVLKCGVVGGVDRKV